MERVGCFEKVSLDQYSNTFVEQYLNGFDDAEIFEDKIKKIHENIRLPERSTSGSAGYDFFVPFLFELKPGQDLIISTGIRCKMEEGWFLSIYPKSGLGFKFHLTLANTIGIIDSDYYYSNNEGHILVKIRNDGDVVLGFEEQDKFCQGIFLPYGVTYDDNATQRRDGGFGSTGR